ncbi:MAG: 3-deoxy-manno-octulosonate cytidylyltransferase [Parasphingopyxis sp.]|nr:3-deoxy-manno-octulosonate cytidylyltransferase [Sphingomonadales bacterium]
MSVVAIIPARWGSTRFPGKPLAAIAGKPMIQHVWERVSAADGVDDVIVAHDDQRIGAVIEALGGRARMTRGDHETGSDRLAEVAERLDHDIVINVQGDVPLVRPEDLTALAQLLRDEPGVQVASLCYPMSAAEAENPHHVKVVCAANGDALYFSRSPIPYPRDAAAARYLHHVGIFAYRRETLLGFTSLPVPDEERAEGLEQLRLLAAGIAIRMIEVEPTGPGVDTPDELAQVEAILAG